MEKNINLINSFLADIKLSDKTFLKKEILDFLNKKETNFDELLLILFSLEYYDIEIVKEKLKIVEEYEELKLDYEKKLDYIDKCFNVIDLRYKDIEDFNEAYLSDKDKKYLKPLINGTINAASRSFKREYGFKCDFKEILTLFGVYQKYKKDFYYNLIAILNYYEYLNARISELKVSKKSFLKNNKITPEILDKVFKKIEEIENYSQEQSRNKEQCKLREDLIKLKNYFTDCKDNSYLELPKEYIDKLPLEILKEICECVNAHNYDLYMKLIDKNVSKIEAILLKYDLLNKFSKEELKELETIDANKVESILIIFNGLPYNFCFSNQDWLNIFNNSNEQNIKTILKALNLKYITLDFINNYLYIFYEPDFQIFKNNLDSLINKNIKVNCLNELMLVDNLENYINLVKHYALDLNNIFVLKNMIKPYFFDYLDLFIEQGLYDILKNDLTILNEDLNVLIKRLIIARSIKIPLLNSEGKINYFIRNQFFIPDSLLDNYIFNSTTLKIDETNLNEPFKLEISLEDNEFENFSDGDLIYNFNGIIISRLKYLRNRKILNDDEYMLECLVKNSILNLEQFEELQMITLEKKLKLQK